MINASSTVPELVPELANNHVFGNTGVLLPCFPCTWLTPVALWFGRSAHTGRYQNTPRSERHWTNLPGQRHTMHELAFPVMLLTIHELAFLVMRHTMHDSKVSH